MQKENTKKRVVYNGVNSYTRPYKGKSEFQPSLTVPDQTMSMREMLIRHGGQQPVEAAVREKIFTGESGGVNPMSLDNVDIQSRKISNKKNIKQLENKLELEKAQEEAIEAEKTAAQQE